MLFYFCLHPRNQRWTKHLWSIRWFHCYFCRWSSREKRNSNLTAQYWVKTNTLYNIPHGQIPIPCQLIDKVKNRQKSFIWIFQFSFWSMLFLRIGLMVNCKQKQDICSEVLLHIGNASLMYNQIGFKRWKYYFFSFLDNKCLAMGLESTILLNTRDRLYMIIHVAQREYLNREHILII